MLDRRGMSSLQFPKQRDGLAMTLLVWLRWTRACKLVHIVYAHADRGTVSLISIPLCTPLHVFSRANEFSPPNSLSLDFPFIQRPTLSLVLFISKHAVNGHYLAKKEAF